MAGKKIREDFLPLSMNNELQDLVFKTDRSKLPQYNRIKKPAKKKALRGGKKTKAIGSGRGKARGRGGKKSSRGAYQGGGVNISYNPYQAMGLVKNEKGQIVRDQNVDLDKNAFFNYEYDN